MSKNEKRDNIIEIRKERTPGEIVAERRRKLCWSQADLEWRSGVSTTQISRIERDLVKPNLETIGKLEEALQIPLKAIFLKYREYPLKPHKAVRSEKNTMRNLARILAKKNITEAELEELIEKNLFKRDP